MEDEVQVRRGGGGAVLKFMLFLIVVAIAGGTYVAYTYGADWGVTINGETIDDLQPWEVVGGVIIGILGLIIGLVGGVLGLLIGLAAALVAIALAFGGIAFGLFITAGVILGPFLLLAAVILLIRRSSAEPEVV